MERHVARWRVDHGKIIVTACQAVIRLGNGEVCTVPKLHVKIVGIAKMEDRELDSMSSNDKPAVDVVNVVGCIDITADIVGPRAPCGICIYQTYGKK